MIKLAIVGTRLLECPNDELRARQRIEQAIHRLKPAVIISGGAKGVDTIAEQVALSLGYSEAEGTLVIHRPKVKRFHGPGGYRERDLLIATECTHLLRLSCKEATTYGSGFTADEAERQGKPVVRWQVCES